MKAVQEEVDEAYFKNMQYLMCPCITHYKLNEMTPEEKAKELLIKMTIAFAQSWDTKFYSSPTQ